MMTAPYQQRHYRRRVQSPLQPFEVVVQETDLLIHARHNLFDEARRRVLSLRGQIENFIQQYPAFATTLAPWPAMPAPLIVREMIQAGQQAGTGPMAAVAGAIAAGVGRALLQYSDEVIVENGGDLFLQTQTPVTIGVYAAQSALSLKIGLRLDQPGSPAGICTSSGTVGHSLSYGRADAVCVVSADGALADAVATAVGNRLQTRRDIAPAIDFGRRIDGVSGLLIIMGAELGAWGQIEIVPLQGVSLSE